MPKHLPNRRACVSLNSSSLSPTVLPVLHSIFDKNVQRIAMRSRMRALFPPALPFFFFFSFSFFFFMTECRSRSLAQARTRKAPERKADNVTRTCHATEEFHISGICPSIYFLIEIKCFLKKHGTMLTISLKHLLRGPPWRFGFSGCPL